MNNFILSLPQQLKAGIAAVPDTVINIPHTRVIACGMGGSSIAGEIASTLGDDIVVHWDYELPARTNVQLGGPASTSATDLVICTSWSGNTAETISSYEKALSLGIKPVVITTGGILLEKARANGTPLVLLTPEDTLAPRDAVGYMLGAFMRIIGREHELDRPLSPASLEAQGRAIAGQIGNHIPLLYTSYPLRKIAGFWKLLINEGAQSHAFSNWFPSAGHYEIAALADHKEIFAPILLRQEQELPHHAKDLDALLAFFKEREYNISTIQCSGDTLFEKVFNGFVLGLWVSSALAELKKVDPTSTKLVEEFKKLKK